MHVYSGEIGSISNIFEFHFLKKKWRQINLPSNKFNSKLFLKSDFKSFQRKLRKNFLFGQSSFEFLERIFS
ncbi:hypothetical protein DLM75_09370 [Leptospira stimsonii]|uniref:Uncharacterized protein n=1 Tax=Leptospira stimsonii TaxID=2202203 RepID=A0A396Z588_9LEPT|nr:hypothetical protein DLM75_09370 [Leptospira stimsonii]